MKFIFIWSFIFIIYGIPMLDDVIRWNYEVIGIDYNYRLGIVNCELIRPNHNRQTNDGKIRISRDNNKKKVEKKKDDSWGSYQKVDLPPWMEDDFLNTVDEDDYYYAPNDIRRERRKRNYVGEPTTMYLDDEKDLDEMNSKNFRSLQRQDIPVTYRLHRDLLRYYRKGTRPVTHPKKQISVSMSVFLYQIIKLDAVKNTISLSGSFELVS
uniref:Neur_chan_LBD domain-containing protein n=1 Tax=Parastrongyloides trichosuri TaxID=131310 RepID=A0A0N4Z6V4_PARTI